MIHLKDWGRASSSETQVRTYQTTLCHVPQDCMLERSQIAISPGPYYKIQLKVFQDGSPIDEPWGYWQHASPQQLYLLTSDTASHLTPNSC